MNIKNTTDLVRAARKTEYVAADYEAKADWIQWAETETPSGEPLEVELRLVGNKVTGPIRILQTIFRNGYKRISRAEANKFFEVPVNNNQIEGEAMDSFGNFPDDPNPTYRR